MLTNSRVFRKCLIFVIGMIFLAGCSISKSFETSRILTLNDLMMVTEKSEDLPSGDMLPKLVKEEKRPTLIIGCRDKLSVTIWGRPDMGSQFPYEGKDKPLVSIVQEDGTLLLPFLEPIVVSGLSLSETREKIRKCYSAILPSPEVDVQIVEYQSQIVYLEGAVNKSGGIFLTDTRLTLGEVIAAGGGIHPNTNAAHGFLVREGKQYRLDYRKTQRGFNNIQKIILKNGDRIFFPPDDERVMYVFGEVYKQGIIHIEDKGMTILEALATMGGPDQISANVDQIFLVRPDKHRLSVYCMKLTELLQHQDVAIKPGDRLFIPPTNLALWDRTWRQLLPFFSAGLSYSVIDSNLLQ